jgi:hypothetical protein
MDIFHKNVKYPSLAYFTMLSPFYKTFFKTTQEVMHILEPKMRNKLIKNEQSYKLRNNCNL